MVITRGRERPTKIGLFQKNTAMQKLETDAKGIGIVLRMHFADRNIVALVIHTIHLPRIKACVSPLLV